MNISVGAKTDVGRTRQVNEDSYLVQEPLFVVADGMGGHVAGDVASKTVVQKMTEDTRDAPPGPDALSALVRAANAAVFNKARSDSTLQGMGTTCTVLLLEGTDAHLAHVGDSRAYLFRDDSLQQITEDHTLVQRMVKEGRLNQEEAHRHPQRNIITRVLGVDADVSVDTFSVEAKPGDRFLLCSDGLSSMLEDAEIETVLRDESDPQVAAERLVERANEAGGEDNITVLVVDVRGTGGSPPGGPVSPARASERVESVGAPAEAPSDTGPSSATPLSDGDSEPGGASSVPTRGRGWARALLGLILVAAILLAAAYIGVKYLWLERSFYVGVDEAEVVTVYRGVPGEFAGMELQKVESTTDLELEEVPEFLREELVDGIEVASLEEAQQRVADLEERAADAEFEKDEDARQREQQGDGDSGGKNS